MNQASPAKKLGRPRKGAERSKSTVNVKIELHPGQVAWLEQLVAQFCYGKSKEAIIERWITDRLNELCEAGKLCRPAGSVSEPNLVAFGKEKISQVTATDSQTTQQQTP